MKPRPQSWDPLLPLPPFSAKEANFWVYLLSLVLVCSRNRQGQARLQGLLGNYSEGALQREEKFYKVIPNEGRKIKGNK